MLNHIKEHFFSFNTQPPEGGWFYIPSILQVISCFNTQPPEGGWPQPLPPPVGDTKFQHTAARRRLAVAHPPRAAAPCVSTHSRPKAAGWIGRHCHCNQTFQHTAARRRLVDKKSLCYLNNEFQHTAARRRLAGIRAVGRSYHYVSTHSRPKAAGFGIFSYLARRNGFNTQPPEGGWKQICVCLLVMRCFNTQPPEGGWCKSDKARQNFTPVSTHSRPKAAGLLFQAYVPISLRFNTQPPEGGWI